MGVTKSSAGVPTHHLGEALKQQRESLGLSVRTVAARAGFSPSFISQVENGLASPSIGSLEKIANALSVSLPELFQSRHFHTEGNGVSPQRKRVTSEWSRAEIEGLLSSPQAEMQAMLLKIQPGGASSKTAHRSIREQFVYIVAGSVLMEVDGVEQTLLTGDGISLLAQAAVRWRNESEKPAELLLVSRQG